MSKLRLDQIETLDGTTLINVADLASAAADITTATGLQSVEDAIDNRVVYQASYTALTALNTANFTSGQQFVVKGTTFRWNGTAFKADGPINVETFGATGDGTTNDTAAIQAAIDFAEDGDVVYFPSPEVAYRVESALTVVKEIAIEGGGAQINAIGAIAGVFNLDARKASLSGLYIQGDRTASQKGVRISADLVKVRDMDIHDVDLGIEVWGGVWHRLEHIRAENIVTTVLEVGNVVGTVVEDFRYDTRGGEAEPTTGILLYGEGCNFSDLDFINSGTACHITGSNGRSSTWNFFNSCSFDTSTYGLRITNTDSLQEVKGIMFDHCWFSSHRNQGILLDGNFNTNGISFANCYIVNNEQGGLFVAEATANVEIKSCTFASNSQAAASTYPSLKHNSAGTVSVTASNFTSWGILTTNVSAAIERVLGASYIIIEGCYANSAVADAGFVDGASANPLSIGINYGLLPTLNKQKMEVLFQSGSSDASGDVTFAHNMGADAWTAIAQMDPASGQQVGVRSVDSSNVVMRVTNIDTGAATVSSGPWNITVAIYSQAFT